MQVKVVSAGMALRGTSFDTPALRHGIANLTSALLRVSHLRVLAVASMPKAGHGPMHALHTSNSSVLCLRRDQLDRLADQSGYDRFSRDAHRPGPFAQMP